MSTPLGRRAGPPPSTGPPDARIDVSRSELSSWSYRCERNAMVVTVPITAHTTAISATDATTSRVRRVRGCRPRLFCVRVVDGS
nr:MULTISPECIES: hypothetical protein [Streptomyces]